MSSYLPNIPQPNDNLDFSQGQLLSNFQALDAIFGIDHYKYSDATGNQGFHNEVTTPQFLATPPVLPSVEPTTTTNPIFYGYRQLDVSGNPTNNLGVLQYSRGTSDAVSTPVTNLNSTSASIPVGNGAKINVLDFNGLTRVIATLYVYSTLNDFGVFNVYFNNPTFTYNFTGSTALAPVNAGTILQILNQSGGSRDIFWSLKLVRTT